MPLKNKVVTIPSIREPITKSPGFAKKALSGFKLDLMGLCGFGCRYCSSNWGNYLRINRTPNADEAERQLGIRAYPDTDPSLTIEWPDVLAALARQLAKKPKIWGRGDTLVVSMLTDAFSPRLVQQGVTRRALDMVLEGTSFRIRVLTKNAIVGSEAWIEFFLSHPGRFVVGLSTGTLDDRWAKRVELGTPPPSQRIAALHRLQDAGVPTYGMLCPVFPDVVENDAKIFELVAAVRPAFCEDVWAEPFNDRKNWQAVRDGYKTGSYGDQWLSDVYEQKQFANWSQYATSLYRALYRAAQRDRWLPKLNYLLYEDHIVERDAMLFARTKLAGVLLQCKPGGDGRSTNPHFAHFQRPNR